MLYQGFRLLRSTSTLPLLRYYCAQRQYASTASLAALSSTWPSSVKNAVVALSGGVDSAVATGLLLQQQQDYNITEAIHMTNWNADDDDSITTCMEQDWRDALAVAQHYNIPVRRQSFEKEYWHQVFVPFLDDLTQKGWMGNPDVACNVQVKFGVLYDHVQRRQQQRNAGGGGGGGSAETDMWLATGHYARLWRRRELEAWIEESSSPSSSSSLQGDEGVDWVWKWGRSSASVISGNMDDDPPLLVAAVDRSKDQSYFLSGCTAQQLSRVIFPLGDYYKKRKADDDDDENENGMERKTVREMADDWDLPVANKRDSVGICFIGKRQGGFQAFLRHYYEATGPNKVQLVNVDTFQTIGTVDALTAQASTIGQGARVSGSDVKYFVVGRSTEDVSTLFVCPGTHHPALYSDSIVLASDLSWIMPQIPPPLLANGHIRVQCRIRHLQPLVGALLTRDSQTGECQLLLDQPLRGITPGQRAAICIGEICLGGATILRAGPSYFERNLALPSKLHPAGHNDTSVRMRQASA